nr:GNAT family N-acetyltransferase [Pseudoruegeria sp. HB172150]
MTTERLILRAPCIGDLEAYARFRMDAERTVFLGAPFTKTEAFEQLGELIGHWQLRGYGRFMVTDRETGTPLGVVGPFYPSSWPEPEIAWSLFAEGEGRGIAYEAALASRAWAYETLGWTTAISLIAENNTRSQNLARRLGARPESVYEHPDYGPMPVWRHPSPEELAA